MSGPMRHDEGIAAMPHGAPTQLRTLVLIAATALALYLCYRIALPFVAPLVWALALAVLFVPLQRRLERKLKRPGLAAFLSVLLIGLIVVVPMVLVGQQLITHAAQGADIVQQKVAEGGWRRTLESQPLLAPWVERVERQLDLPATARDIATRISTAAGSIVRGSVYQVIGVVLTFYLLFFFLRDRKAALSSLRSLSPLNDRELDRLCRRIDDTIHATVYGTLAVSSVQGLLGGLMFWWLGLSAPLLWGVVMALLAIVPMVGAFVVWLPAALLLALEGSWIKAVILVLWGMFVVGTVDNLLRPVLVGNRLKLHTVLAFLAVIGGLMLFGPAGLILGPLTLTVTMALLEIWSERGREP